MSGPTLDIVRGDVVSVPEFVNLRHRSLCATQSAAQVGAPLSADVLLTPRLRHGPTPIYLPQTALSALSGLLGQHTRQITIETALTTDNLVVERFTDKEAVSAPFVLHVDCLSPSAHLDTAKLATEEITQRLMLPDGSRRAWHGYVVACAALGGDGRLARYRLTVGSWFDRLRTRSDCFVLRRSPLFAKK